MNLVFETPAVPIDKQYILDNIFHLQEVNTDFGIYTLTVPEYVLFLFYHNISSSFFKVTVNYQIWNLV